VQSSIDQLKDNKVKITIEVDELEVDGAIDLAFKKIAKEVKLPGFRPGRVPRKVLEAKFGQEYARSEALNELIGEKYRNAVISLEVDAISQPEITIKTGEESGPVSFEAVIEIRPEIEISGYKAISVTVPGFEATEEEINGQVDSLREQAADRNEVERPAVTGDYVTIDLSGSQDGEPEENLTTEDFTYEIGSGFIVETIDENLLGTKVGEIVEFEGAHPSEEGSILSFKALVKKIEEKTLPQLTDTFVSEMTEFETVEILINDTKERIEETKRSQASNTLVEQIGSELGDLVSDEPPEALVQEQIQQQLQDMAMRIGQQGMQFDQFLEATGQSIEALAENMKEPAAQVVKIDLALRAVAAAEGITVEAADLDDEIKIMAEHFNQDAKNIEEIFRENGQMLTLKADLLKQQAMRFLEENVEILDPEGNKILHDAFLLPENTDKPLNISENEEEEEEATGGIEPQEEE